MTPQLKAALAKIVEKLRQDENPLEDGVPVETYGYEATYNKALDDMALALQPEIERLVVEAANKVFIDFPTGHKLTEIAKVHEDKCSSMQMQGFMCDCSVLKAAQYAVDKAKERLTQSNQKEEK